MVEQRATRVSWLYRLPSSECDVSQSATEHNIPANYFVGHSYGLGQRLIAIPGSDVHCYNLGHWMSEGVTQNKRGRIL